MYLFTALVILSSRTTVHLLHRTSEEVLPQRRLLPPLSRMLLHVMSALLLMIVMLLWLSTSWEMEVFSYPSNVLKDAAYPSMPPTTIHPTSSVVCLLPLDLSVHVKLATLLTIVRETSMVTQTTSTRVSTESVFQSFSLRIGSSIATAISLLLSLIVSIATVSDTAHETAEMSQFL